MAFSAGDHFKSRIAVPAPEAARLGKLVMFRSSNAAFYLRPVVPCMANLQSSGFRASNGRYGTYRQRGNSTNGMVRLFADNPPGTRDDRHPASASALGCSRQLIAELLVRHAELSSTWSGRSEAKI